MQIERCSKGLLRQALWALLAWPVLACAQSAYPAKPIRFIVGFPPGGTNDIVARMVAQKFAESIGQSVVVDNRGGANTSIACEMFVRTPPDGYTIMLNSPGHATNPAMMKLGFDSIRDFAFITQFAESVNLVVVHPSLPVRSVKELIAHSKERPGVINYASSGTGTTVHLSAELFQYMTGVKWAHIPYKGAGLAIPELLAGQTSIMFANMPSVIQFARSGKLRALAVTGSKRVNAAPEIPTVSESGIPGYEVTTWYGVSAPAKTPRAIVARLHDEFVKVLAVPEMRARLQEAGAEPVGSTPEAYTAYVRNEIDKWTKVIRAAGIKGE